MVGVIALVVVDASTISFAATEARAARIAMLMHAFGFMMKIVRWTHSEVLAAGIDMGWLQAGQGWTAAISFFLATGVPATASRLGG
jgi:hypothetical protein